MTLYPQRRVFALALAGFLVATLPLHVALYWSYLTSPSWWVGPVFSTLLLVGVLAVILWFRRSRIHIGSDTVSGNLVPGPFRRTIATADIATVLIFDLRRAHNPRPILQVYALDADNRILARVRSVYWTYEDLTALVTAIGISPLRIDRVLSIEELQRNHGHLLYWFERSPYLRSPRRRSTNPPLLGSTGAENPLYNVGDNRQRRI